MGRTSEPGKRPGTTGQRIAVMLLLVSAVVSCGAAQRLDPPPPRAAVATACPRAGDWLVPSQRNALTTQQILARIEGSRVVLLGEDHDRPDHHRWQLQTIAALHGRRPEIVLAFEMLPRASQLALDEWAAGKLSEAEFLDQSRWDAVWGFPAELYMPAFHFGRMNRLPMVALNVDRELIARVSSAGWNAIGREDRAGLGDPAVAAPEYRAMLEGVFAEHERHGDPDNESTTDRFIEAQLLWDRAFAEGIRDALQRHPGALVVALIGSGHLENGYGVAHQLDDLGIDEVATLLPWDVATDCDDLAAGLADAVFGIRPIDEIDERPQLGVFIESVDNGLVVRQVMDDSIAAAAGIQPDDVIVNAAGQSVETPGQLKKIVGRQPPGTVLPLTIERLGTRVEIEARFPVGE